MLGLYSSEAVAASRAGTGAIPSGKLLARPGLNSELFVVYGLGTAPSQ